MNYFHSGIVVSVMLPAFLLCLDASADIYKCREVDGSLTYSQTPCPNSETNEKVVKSKPEPAVEPRDCEYAQKFAQATAKSMRDGYVSSDIFKLYGGIDSLSKGSINIINYVYTYRTTENVSVERIAELTVSQCQTGAIENASCEDLPLSFTDRIGGCDVEEKLAEKPADVIGPDTSAQTEPASDSDGDATDSHQANIRSADTASQCKERYQTEIDNIDNRMRSGYSSSQGERLREQRRDLREKIRQC